MPIHYLNVCHSGKSKSKSAKKQRLQRLPHICHSAKYKRSSSSHWRTGTRKSKSRSRRFDFLRRSRSHNLFTTKTIPSCMTMYDNVTVAVIVSEIWAFKNFHLNVCQCHKSRSRSPEVTLGTRPLSCLPSCQI